MNHFLVLISRIPVKKIATIFVFILSLNFSFGQQPFAGYSTKISGEDITYFSPFRSFAKEALLTRCDGQSAIEWEAQEPNILNSVAQFKFLIGFSSGTSAQDRLFDLGLSWVRRTDDFVIQIYDVVDEKQFLLFVIEYGLDFKRCD